MNAKIEFARGLRLYQPIISSRDIPNETPEIFCDTDCGKFTTSSYSHFPYIIEPNGSLWEQGNLYLLSKFKDVSDPILGTLESFARDLKTFRSWTLNEGIDYLHFPARKLRRPTYKYHGHLSDLVLLGKIKSSTAKRRMNTVENFYEWLIRQGQKFEFSPWSDSYSSSLNSKKRHRLKSSPKTTLSSTFRTPLNKHYSTEYINDQGKLRPLVISEQDNLIKFLREIGNTEMTLAFLLAISTGARLSRLRTY